jgi:phospholipase C
VRTVPEATDFFIVNYDEAGGFYDHMQPPMPPLTPEQGHSTVSVAGEAKVYVATLWRLSLALKTDLSDLLPPSPTGVIGRA